MHVLVQITLELLERAAIDLAFEVAHHIHRHPVLVPAPGVEFGMTAGAQRNVAIAPGQPQKKPDLLLPAIEAAIVATRPVGWHVVTQTFARTPEDATMRGLPAPYFFKDLRY